MKRAIAREEQERAKAMEEQKRMTDLFASRLVIAASIIAAIRLAREQDISRPSPRLTSVVMDSIGLARMILEKIVR
jgi:ABC-type glucose/galactose transport system permease subunit